jgi:hypothetical protein
MRPPILAERRVDACVSDVPRYRPRTQAMLALQAIIRGEGHHGNNLPPLQDLLGSLIQ